MAYEVKHAALAHGLCIAGKLSVCSLQNVRGRISRAVSEDVKEGVFGAIV